VRDFGKRLLTHGSVAAEAGILFRDKALCRLAARYAMSIAHCGKWEYSFRRFVPGIAWENRAFVASLCIYDCALILDLCGEWFTELGRTLILRRIAEEGEGALNMTSWWWEYMYHTNQMPWITPGRVMGYLVLERTQPEGFRAGRWPRRATSRVERYTDAAIGDLMESLANVLLPDGGYDEGPSYFAHTTRQAFLALYHYARARGRNLRDLVPEAVRATSRFAEMLVSTDERGIMILVCDAMYVNQEAAAWLAWLMPDSHWVSVYHNTLRRTGGRPCSLLVEKLAREIPPAGPAFQPLVEMPSMGMMCSVRRLGPETVKLFSMGNKADSDHSHEDKGSFVLEFAGESFAFDYGVVDYANPVCLLLKRAQRHNMLVPVAAGDRPRPSNPIAADIHPKGGGDAVRFRAEADLTPGWEGWYRHWRRTWDSPAPAELTITDEWELEKGEGVAFHWTTPLPLTLDVEARTVTISGRRGRAILEYPADCSAQIEHLPLIDERQRTIDRQRLEMAAFVYPLDDTQPRLTLFQKGSRGRLSVRVRLECL
jgi:Heparinase II/III-like protein